MNALTISAPAHIFGRSASWVPIDRRIDPSPKTSATIDIAFVPAWFGAVSARLAQLRGLKAGWDGYASPPIRGDIFAYAESILESIMLDRTPAPSIMPVSGGGLQMEWHRQGASIELLLAGPLMAELFVEYVDGRPSVEVDLSSDFARVSEVLAEIADD